MRHYLYLLFFITFLPLILTACAPTREDADSKLAAACEASIKDTFTDPKNHIAVQNASFSFKKSSEDLRLRVVTLKAKYNYGNSEPDDKTYVCAYTEEWSLFSWLPEFYNLQNDDDKYGNFDGNILGDPTVLLKIATDMQDILNPRD